MPSESMWQGDWLGSGKSPLCSGASQFAAGYDLFNPPDLMFFIGTLSQTLTLRAAFASSTYLLPQIPGPGRSSDDDLSIPPTPFSRGRSGPSGFPSPLGLPCPPAPGPKTDEANFIHADIVPFDALSLSEQEKDKTLIDKIDEICS